MLLRKEGFPDEDELVVCTVTKVQFHSVFVNLDEYDRGGMIHISEVSPGRIRNIRDFVKEGKKVVCKVLRVNSDKGHIDLSLRRVTETQKRNKIDETKQQQKAEKILEFVSKNNDITLNKIFDTVMGNISGKYPSLYGFFQSVVTDDKAINDAGLDAKLSKSLEESIKTRIKEVKVKIEGKLSLSTYAPNGVEIIKEALTRAKANKDNISIKYLGGGTFSLIVNASDYKSAEKVIQESTERALDYITEHEGYGKFARIGQ
jgi:translation initiation factor 2 subunit 1